MDKRSKDKRSDRLAAGWGGRPLAKVTCIFLTCFSLLCAPTGNTAPCFPAASFISTTVSHLLPCLPSVSACCSILASASKAKWASAQQRHFRTCSLFLHSSKFLSLSLRQPWSYCRIKVGTATCQLAVWEQQTSRASRCHSTRPSTPR